MRSWVADPVVMGLVRPNFGMKALALNISKSPCQIKREGNAQEAGNDLVFFRIFLLGDAFFLPLLLMMDSTIC